METVSLSQMADFIIVLCFFVAAATAWIYIFVDAIGGIADIIRDHRDKKKEQKKLKAEAAEKEAAQEAN